MSGPTASAAGYEIALDRSPLILMGKPGWTGGHSVRRPVGWGMAAVPTALALTLGRVP